MQKSRFSIYKISSIKMNAIRMNTIRIGMAVGVCFLLAPRDAAAMPICHPIQMAAMEMQA